MYSWVENVKNKFSNGTWTFHCTVSIHKVEKTLIWYKMLLLMFILCLAKLCCFKVLFSFKVLFDFFFCVPTFDSSLNLQSQCSGELHHSLNVFNRTQQFGVSIKPVFLMCLLQHFATWKALLTHCYISKTKTLRCFCLLI